MGPSLGREVIAPSHRPVIPTHSRDDSQRLQTQVGHVECLDGDGIRARALTSLLPPQKRDNCSLAPARHTGDFTWPNSLHMPRSPVETQNSSKMGLPLTNSTRSLGQKRPASASHWWQGEGGWARPKTRSARARSKELKTYPRELGVIMSELKL